MGGRRLHLRLHPIPIWLELGTPCGRISTRQTTLALDFALALALACVREI